MGIPDGDSVKLRVDRGFEDSWYPKKGFRLFGINTPENHGVKIGSEEYVKGMAAFEFAREWYGVPEDGGKWYRGTFWLTEPAPVLIRSHDGMQYKSGKYGRWLVEVYGPSGEGSSLNEELVNSGHAVLKAY